MGSLPKNPASIPAVTLPGLSNAARLQGVLIEDERICPGCSQSLQGLRTGDRCPECGMPIPMRAGARHGWMMTHSPMDYLRHLAHGSIWMLASALVLVGSLVWMGVELVWGTGFSVTVGIFSLLAAGCWMIGVCMVTAPRPQEPGNPGTRVAEWRGLRWAARISQGAWVLGTALILSAGWLRSGVAFRIALPNALTPFPAGIPSNAQQQTLILWGCMFLGVGILGLSLLAFYLARLADWADDPALARKLRMTPFALSGAAVLAALMALCRPLLHSLPLLFVMIPVLAVTAGLFLLCASHFGVALVQFASVGVWARQNASTALDTGRRMSSKIVRRIVDAQAKPSGEPVRAPQGHKPAKPQGAYVAPHGDGVPYQLAPPASEPPPRPLGK